MLFLTCSQLKHQAHLGTTWMRLCYEPVLYESLSSTHWSFPSSHKVFPLWQLNMARLLLFIYCQLSFCEVPVREYPCPLACVEWWFPVGLRAHASHSWLHDEPVDRHERTLLPPRWIGGQKAATFRHRRWSRICRGTHFNIGRISIIIIRDWKPTT